MLPTTPESVGAGEVGSLEASGKPDSGRQTDRAESSPPEHPASAPATFDQPRQVLLEAAVRELQSPCRVLRELGWPAEIVAVNEPNWFGVRLEIQLDALRSWR